MIDELKLRTGQGTGEHAVVAALNRPNEPRALTEEHLEELKFLAATAQITVVEQFVQKLEKPDQKTFLGKGKIEEIKAYILAHNIDTLVFDEELSPAQVRNLSGIIKARIIDRSLLILNIFEMRAQTAQAKLQVELAHYQYLYPRLTRMWTHHSRQQGGTGVRGGPGEKELETDRRMIQKRITLLKEKLAKIDKQSATRRKSRSNIVRVALVGYTNAGKSTLMNRLAKAEVFAENKLFATLDSTVRKIVLDQIPFLLTDTVGFIRKLPPNLIESFKSTLDEIREADVLIHVYDLGSHALQEHQQTVRQTLKDLGADQKKELIVYNKIDEWVPETPEAEAPEELTALQWKHRQLKMSHLNEPADKTVFLSAGQNYNIAGLRGKLLERVKEVHYTIYPHSAENSNGLY